MSIIWEHLFFHYSNSGLLLRGYI